MAQYFKPKRVVALTKQQRRALLRVGVGAVVLLILATSVYAIRVLTAKKRPIAKGPVCSSTVLKQASKVLDYAHLSELKKISDTVTQLKDYETDPNCLYIVADYYLTAGDLVQGKAYMDKLNKVYNPKVGISQTLGFGQVLEKLQNRLKLLEKQNVELQHNSSQWSTVSP